jgi:DNA-binding transcriptional LysR family regulator
MTHKDPGWELYRTFLDVVRDGSLSGAARRLGLTQPTVGRHIDALEQALDLALFTRSPRGLIPTAAALDLVPHAESMAAAAAALRRTASGEAAAETGTVRLATSELVGCEILPPILAAFRHKHPGISIELALSNRVADLLRRDADIAIRLVRPTQDGLVARKIGVVRIGLYAHRDYIARFGMPDELEALFKHGFIGFDRDDWSFRSIGVSNEDIGKLKFAFKCDSDPAQFAALKAGLGIGGCQVQLAERTPGLVRLLPDIVNFTLDSWIVTHEDLKGTRRVRLLFDHLATGLAACLVSGHDQARTA